MITPFAFGVVITAVFLIGCCVGAIITILAFQKGWLK